MARSAIDQLLQQLVHSVTGVDVSFVMTSRNLSPTNECILRVGNFVGVGSQLAADEIDTKEPPIVQYRRTSS